MMSGSGTNTRRQQGGLSARDLSGVFHRTHSEKLSLHNKKKKLMDKKISYFLEFVKLELKHM